MFVRLRRLLNRFFNQSRTINDEPLNKVSLIVIILIDIFILVNVFTGLNDISQWYISPTQAYPCYSEWQTYRTQTDSSKDFNRLRAVLGDRFAGELGFQASARQAETDHLGNVSPICLKFADYKDKINTPNNQQTLQTIDQQQTKISTLEQTNSTIRSQYDSTLLEKIAGQPQDQSINLVGAEKAKQTLDQNNRAIATLKSNIAQLKRELLAKPESQNYFAFLQDDASFQTVEKGYRQASFWYPSIQFLFQALFLLPLILIALIVHRLAHRRGYGLVALISWHLLVIFCVPLIFKALEFLQVGVLFKFLFDVIKALFGGLLFLVSYAYILLIPLLGFGLIKFFQKFVFNPRVQAASRVQKSRCVRCAKTIRTQDDYCPHCGYHQVTDCPNCHTLTYKHLMYCRHCGYAQDGANRLG